MATYDYPPETLLEIVLRSLRELSPLFVMIAVGATREYVEKRKIADRYRKINAM